MTEDKELLARWQAGDEQAAEELYRRYANRLWALAKERIGQRLGRRIDADDIVQSVLRTFFRRTREGQFTVDCSGALWQLLVKITVHKVQRKAHYHTAGRRDVRSEIPLDWEASPDIVAQAPAEESADMLVAELDDLLQGLSQREEEVVRLCLEGYSTPEIGARVGSTRWTVRRVLDRVGNRLLRQISEDPRE
jgi:RNA polymerase sigma factor (sigma-70 family)